MEKKEKGSKTMDKSTVALWEKRSRKGKKGVVGCSNRGWMVDWRLIGAFCLGGL